MSLEKTVLPWVETSIGCWETEALGGLIVLLIRVRRVRPDSGDFAWTVQGVKHKYNGSAKGLERAKFECEAHVRVAAHASQALLRQPSPPPLLTAADLAACATQRNTLKRLCEECSPGEYALRKHDALTAALEHERLAAILRHTFELET